MKFFLVFIAFIGASGCSHTQPLVIYNGCSGSWIRVHEGNGDLLIDRLDYGKEASVDVRGYQGRTIQLLAAGFELNTDRPLGSAIESRSIPSNGGIITSPSQLVPWRITSLQTSDTKGGCKR